MKKENVKVKGFKLSQSTIEKLEFIAKDFRDNQSMTIERLIDEMYQSKIKELNQK